METIRNFQVDIGYLPGGGGGGYTREFWIGVGREGS